MKNVLLILSLVFLLSCEESSEQTVLDPVEVTSPRTLPQPTTMPLTIVIEGCEYIQYKSTLFCGHQYTHHTYQAYFLTHSGKCKSHEINKQ